jgi:phosphoglycolate phosphatase-like HAD superfamily hydrolase
LLRLLALDFDGVISDSAPESFAVALLTYTQMIEGSKFGDRRAALEAGSLPTPSWLTEDPLYASFLGLMPLGNRAEDFAISLSALEASRTLADQADYDAFRSELDEEWLQEFHRRFYRNRTALSRRDSTGWRRMMGPYPPFLEILHRRAGDAMLAIATAKDAATVDALMRDYGIEALFPPERVLDKETGVHKDAHLQLLHETVGVAYDEMVFVDDKVNHLDRVARLGVRCALAGWGYNGEREVELARQRGYRVCTLENAEEQLFDWQQADPSDSLATS